MRRPAGVEHAKARSHGELVEDLALVISDVEIDGKPKAGLRMQVHGVELVAQRREQQERAQERARVIADAQKVRGAVAGAPGINTRDLRAVTRLSGDRLAAAVVHLGDVVERREEKQGRSTAVRHYLRGDQ